jgi:hypothetical protein
MDDWPHFEPGPGRSGLSAPSAVLEIWTEELRYAHEHAPGGLVMITVHPECIGRGHRMAMLERFIEAAAARMRAEQAAGDAPAADADTMAFALVWMCERTLYQQLVQQQRFDMALLAETLEAIWMRAIYGRD